MLGPDKEEAVQGRISNGAADREVMQPRAEGAQRGGVDTPPWASAEGALGLVREGQRSLAPAGEEH